jgi:hypothetical protein
MGQIILLPLRRKACCEFFQPKKSTASVGSEPAILGNRVLYSFGVCIFSDRFYRKIVVSTDKVLQENLMIYHCHQRHWMWFYLSSISLHFLQPISLRSINTPVLYEAASCLLCVWIPPYQVWSVFLCKIFKLICVRLLTAELHCFSPVPHVSKLFLMSCGMHPW